MNTLWQEKEFEQICSRESLTEKAAEIETTISVKVHEKERQISKIPHFSKYAFRHIGWIWLFCVVSRGRHVS